MSNNTQYNNNQKREEAPNKVGFTSVSLKENERGSPVVTLRLSPEGAEKMANLLGEISQTNEHGANLTVQIIPGKKYDSGYVYINPKQPPQDRSQGNGNGGSNGQRSFSKFNKKPANAFGADKTKAYLNRKQLKDEDSEQE